MNIRDLLKVADHPEVRAAMERHDTVLEASKTLDEAYRQCIKEFDGLVEQLDAELAAAVKRALNE